MGSSLMRVKATIGAPERSSPYSGKAWKCFPLATASSDIILAAVTAPWPPRACHRIPVSFSVKSHHSSCRIIYTDTSSSQEGRVTLPLHGPVSYTHLRAHETKANLVCRLLLAKKKKRTKHCDAQGQCLKVIKEAKET